MLSTIENLRYFFGFSIPNSEIVIFHLQYADDTLIFCDVESAQISNIARVLEVCEVTLGLKVNFHKSSLVGTNCERELIEDLATLLGCKVGSFPILYLGLPISDLRLTIAVWDIVLERVQGRLALWKHKYLSLGGGVTLLRTCLANLPIYQMSLIHMPASVVKRLEKMMRDFLWGSSDENMKFHLLNWDRVCSPKKEGGLGIRKITLVNQALLYKWWWRSLLLKTSCVERKNMWIGGGRGNKISHMWKAVYNCRPIVSGYFKWNLGDGMKVSFWHHKWLGEYPLKLAYPDLFRIVTQPDLTVCEAINRRGYLISWNITLAYSQLSDAILSQWYALMELLSGVYASCNAVDEVIREIEQDGIFSVKSCYNLLFHDRWRDSCPMVAKV
ncbi:hypothetical protein AMTRI_Chr02g265480 [Amborella trichopoda]